ncbi:MAG: YbaB/EbfC family nucleoid-associated protein [Acidimicrobiales bacterium]|jgi:DNA-binding YbaB/EbfC family protein
MTEGESSATGGLGDLFARLEEARADLEAQAEAIEATSVEGHAAGGAVVIRLTGSLEAESVHIDPSLVDPTDPTLLEDAVLAALQDALDRITELRSSVQSPADAAGGLDLGGLVGNLDLGGLLAGVDIQGLIGNLGMGQDLGAFAGFGALGEGEDEDEDNEDPVDGAGDEPQA